ncbi:MAG: SDR family oxidoreductase [Methylococcaceae bacterium]|nr:SDR family oxidoreductase [Methylococcaceae bacterium]MDD1630723.1 SDR family oxidoreductase [Methylococcaceae bacterium]MDD1636631.1 SDR family oxidoreductase [Methylococcaceae bacterium]MDD1642431.1 SDR family oxidoreductase [Methylococcaceae bacterium]OYV20909.1 MAG: short-chain dehydrogenase [Methylococcaceae bacterium NSM2-1]
MHTIKRTVLVTGASSGIGRAIAQNLLQQGHAVIGVSRDCRKFIRQMDNFSSAQLDLSDLKELPQKIRQLQQKFPEIDAVVFSAGMGRFGSMEEFSYPQIEALMTINFTSQVFLTKALLPALKRKANSDLIFIGSEAALKGTRKGAVYCASKFALRGFTQALREECGNSHVRVCLINPGMVKTPFFEQLNFEPGDHESNTILPEDVADAVSYVLDSRTQIVIDEINLSPLNKVVKFKKL